MKQKGTEGFGSKTELLHANLKIFRKGSSKAVPV